MNHANDNELPRSRAEAKKIGSKQYFTGEPCKHGHIAARCTCDGQCMECSRIKSLKRYYVNQDEMNAKAREYNKARYAEDPVYRKGRLEYAKMRRQEIGFLDKQREYDKQRRANMTEEERDKGR